jgi:5-deoxy-glucuronate isomerase
VDAHSRSRHIHASGRATGYDLIAYPPDSPLRFIEFATAAIGPGGAPLTWESRDREAVLYLIGGICEYTVSGFAGSAAGVLDTRPSIFDGPPTAVYVPPGSKLGVASPRMGARVAIISAPPSADRRLRQIHANEVSTRTVGKATWASRVTIVADARTTSRLIVGETIVPQGHWASYPPHKHDTTSPGQEVSMEEVNHFLFKPSSGFGLQVTYTRSGTPDAFSDTHRVRDGDTVVIPRGYHSVSAAGGYALAYVWALAGQHVEYGAWIEDPAHSWVHR